MPTNLLVTDSSHIASLRSRMIISSLLLLIICIEGARAFVFSCNEIKYQLINKTLEFPTRYACLVLESDFDVDSLNNIYAQTGDASISLWALRINTCIERPNDASWSFVGFVDLNCTKELSLIFTSTLPNVNEASQISPWMDHQMKNATVDEDHEQIFVVPQTGIRIHSLQCLGDGNITAFAGAGSGETESRFTMKSWKCADLPTWIISFDNVVTLSAGKGTWLAVEYVWNANNGMEVTVASSDRVAVISSGLSDNVQNLPSAAGWNENQWYFKKPTSVFVSCSPCYFDPASHGRLKFTASEESFWNVTDTQILTDAADITMETQEGFGIKYYSALATPENVGSRQDNFVVELTFTDIVPPILEKDPYCGCALTEYQQGPVGWDPRNIWLDVVIVLDTSEAMTQDDLDIASLVMMEIFAGPGEKYLTTNTRAKFFIRVGLITMAEQPQVRNNLNMTIDDMYHVLAQFKVTKGLDKMNFEDALNAAETMLTNGQTPDRATTRKVIYFMTNSEPSGQLSTADRFKNGGGIIIVNNYIKEGEVHPGLFNLASPGYYRTDIQENEWLTLQLFCKANCFCRTDNGRVPYNGHSANPELTSSGGCFQAVPASSQFLNARKICGQLGGGLVSSIHDYHKGQFVQQLLTSASKSGFYWIGYTRTDSVEGSHGDWEDKSTNPYTNWDEHQPSKLSHTKCAYADASSNLWGAGNCNIAYPSVCEFAPCEAGNKNC